MKKGNQLVQGVCVVCNISRLVYRGAVYKDREGWCTFCARDFARAFKDE